jgi:hypothetical protein
MAYKLEHSRILKNAELFLKFVSVPGSVDGSSTRQIMGRGENGKVQCPV